jgi:hypothetical protein
MGTLQLGGLRQVACAQPQRGTSSDCYRFQSSLVRHDGGWLQRNVTVLKAMTRRGTHSSIRSSGTIFSLCWFLALSLLRSARLVRAKRGSVARRQLRGSGSSKEQRRLPRYKKQKKCEPSHVLLPQWTQA